MTPRALFLINLLHCVLNNQHFLNTSLISHGKVLEKDAVGTLSLHSLP